MPTNEMECLHSFLNEGGRELKNVKFFPGTSRGLTGDQMVSAACAAIRNAFARGLPDEPPMTGKVKVSFATRP
jgi:hypothetical protein